MSATSGPRGRLAAGSRLQRLREFGSALKPRLVRTLLGAMMILGIAAQIFKPLGDALSSKGYLGGSFAAFVALVLFDALTSTEEPREVSGVRPLSSVNELREQVARAFDERQVRIDFLGFTMETLVGILRDPLERLCLGGGAVKSLQLRIIVPDLEAPMSLPCQVVPEQDPVAAGRLFRFADSPEFRHRMRTEFLARHQEALDELLGMVRAARPGIAVSCDVRRGPQSPIFKLFIVNDQESYFGYYSIKPRPFDQQTVWDPQAFGGTRLIGWSRRSRTASTREIADYHARWFDTMWSLLGGEAHNAAATRVAG